MSIVRLEQVFYADGKVLMVLEYLPGGDLFDGLVSRPYYSEKDACACARQIIMALNYLSRKGIIHRVRKRPERKLPGLPSLLCTSFPLKSSLMQITIQATGTNPIAKRLISQKGVWVAKLILYSNNKA